MRRATLPVPESAPKPEPPWRHEPPEPPLRHEPPEPTRLISTLCAWIVVILVLILVIKALALAAA